MSRIYLEESTRDHTGASAPTELSLRLSILCIARASCLDTAKPAAPAANGGISWSRAGSQFDDWLGCSLDNFGAQGRDIEDEGPSQNMGLHDFGTCFLSYTKLAISSAGR